MFCRYGVQARAPYNYKCGECGIALLSIFHFPYFFALFTIFRTFSHYLSVKTIGNPTWEGLLLLI